MWKRRSDHVANEAASSIPARLDSEKIRTAPIKAGSKISRAITLSNPVVGRSLFYVGCFLIALVVWWTERRLQAGPQVFGELITDLDSSQQSQLSAFLEMNRLIITLSTTTLGAVGFFLSRDRKGRFIARELWAASACAVCVGLSLFYGYHAYQDIIFMLQYNTFDLNTSLIAWDRQWHLATFVLGTFFFADFAFNELNRKEETRSNDVSHA
jgi:hypothetical protein